MLEFCLVFFCMTIYNVSEARTLQALIGSDVSFSLTVTKITNDMFIVHNKSIFMPVWPSTKSYSVHKEKERVQVSIDMSRGETITVTIFLLNITKENSGIYAVAKERDTEINVDSVLLQAIEGRTVQAVIGRNVSFSFICSNITTTDAIFIRHDTSLFLSVWPAQNLRIPHKEPDRVRASVDMSLGETITVTVSLLNITRKDGGIYTVTKQLNSDEFVDCVLLQVTDDTIIPRIDIVRHMVSDSSLVLQCLSSSSYTGNLIWKLNASLIEKIDRYSYNNDYLSIRNLTADDQYNSYTCLEEGQGLESDPYRLKANGPSVVDFTPNKTVVIEHDSLNISCISDCNPVCTYKWTKMGLETDVSADNVLYIHNIKRQHSGKYTCKVQNVISGTSYTNILALDVVYGPDEILLNVSNTIMEMDEFDSIAIFCSADCFPPCQIHWNQSNKHMPGANLWLNNLQKDGNFTCHATNERNVNTSISKTISIIMKSGNSYYTTTAQSVTNDTETSGSRFTTTANNKMGDTGSTELRINRLLVYLVIGMGVLLITGFCICILRKFVKCSCLNKEPENMQIQECEEDNPLQLNKSGGYWTIACNREGDLSTVLETSISQINEPIPSANITVTEMNTLETSPQLQRTEVGMEFDGYIHAIHSDPVNTGFMPTYNMTEV